MLQQEGCAFYELEFRTRGRPDSSELAWYEASKKTLRWWIYGCTPWYEPQRPLTNIANISHEGLFDHSLQAFYDKAQKPL